MLDGLISMDDKPECIIPVPMHSKRIRKRGFNQTVLLAKRLGKALNIPCLSHLCVKSKPSEQQAGLSKQRRIANPRGTFEARAFEYKKILLVDDILTTGSTADEISKQLKKQGAETVYVSCCARTQAPDDE